MKRSTKTITMTVAAILLLTTPIIWSYGKVWLSGTTISTLSQNGALLRVRGIGVMETPVLWRGNFLNVRENITALIIEDGVKSIGEGAFANCYKLKSVTIPNSVNSIGGWAFSSCYDLESIIIPNSVRFIGDNAFFAGGLTSVEIGGGVEYIGENSFRCKLKSINVRENNLLFSSIGGVLFNKAKDTLVLYPNAKHGSYTIPNCVTSIYGDAFSGCYGLTSVTIPNSVKSIGSGAFSQCDSLTSVVSLNLTPPNIRPETFKDLPKGVCLYIPESSFDAYSVTYWWVTFEYVKPLSAAPKSFNNTN